MKRSLIKLTGMLVTTAIALSCNGGIVLANEVENPDEEIVTANEEPAQEPQKNEAGDPAEGSPKDNTSTNSNETGNSDLTIDGTYTTTVKVDYNYDNKELAGSYINHVFGINDSLNSSTKKRSFDPTSGYSESKKTFYNILRKYIVDIASGNKTNTQITISRNDLVFIYPVSELVDDPSDITSAKKKAMANFDLDYKDVIHDLTSSCPYDLYWYDKTTGAALSYAIGTSTVSGTTYVVILDFECCFTVAEDFRASNEYTVNTTFSQLVNTAHTNAMAIVDNYKSLDDYKKLEAYKDKICELVEYNYDALNEGTPYGNPWQLIWVFDNDASTKVVCEGYSKAFQYLCDNTKFNSSKIYAQSVHGNAVLRNSQESVTGGHMWNVVHMDDDKNYLVDVTNCDTGFSLFMIGYAKKIENGYAVNNGAGQLNDYPYDAKSDAPELAASDYVYIPDPSFNTKHGMIFNDCIGVRFIIDFPANFDPTNCYVTFTTPAGRENIVTYEESVARNNDGTSRYFACYINALELADDITATIHYGDDKELTSDSYSALDYFNTIRDTMTNNQSLISLVNDLQAFGYYCQQAGFSDNRKHENIPAPAKTLTSADIESTKTKVASYVMDKQLGSSGIDSNIKIALALTSKTELRISVKPSAGVTIKSTGYTVRTINGETYYQFAIGKIGPKALGDPKTFTIVTDKGTATINVPAINYVKAVLDNDSFTTNQKYAVVAYYNYFSSAVNYKE